MRMKTSVSPIIFLIALFFVPPPINGFGFTFQEGRACFPVPAGLNGWWPGDGHSEDIVGGRDASLQDNAGFGLGLVDQSFVLDGDGDFVSIPHSASLNLGTGDFTIDLWVYFNDTSGEQVLVEKWIQRSSGASEGWTLTKLEDNAIRLAMASDGEDEIDVDSGVLSIPTGTWIHFAATRKNGKVNIYMNGRPVAAGESYLNLDSNSSLKFGHRGNSTDTPGSEDESQFFLNGRIDEVELFAGRALPRGLIQAIFNAGSAGKCKK